MESRKSSREKKNIVNSSTYYRCFILFFIIAINCIVTTLALKGQKESTTELSERLIRIVFTKENYQTDGSKYVLKIENDNRKITR